MAPRDNSSDAGSRKTWMVALSLVVLFATALFLRTYWNADAAIQDGHFVLSSGSDPYYEKRAIDAIQENEFRTLIHDPLLNYPYGAVNPNPPLYQWSVAAVGHLIAPFFDAHPEMGLSQQQYATWWATEWAPAIYGSLTIFPIYFIAATLFDRRAGILAALFWTIATEAVDVTGLGDSRHYAAAMFFTSLAFLFYLKTLEQFRGDGNWIGSWRNGGDIGRGLGAVLRARRLGFGYAALTGMSIAAVALMWKGFPYIIGTIFIYASLQLVIDHWRNRDSTGLFLATALAMLVGMVVAYPYYAQAAITNFLRPAWFIVGAFVIAGLVLVPTRDLPTILVLPAAGIVALLGIGAAFFVFPEVSQGLLYATVYFKQTALYETIAEAHPADFSQIAFAVGPVAFGLAFFMWFRTLFDLHSDSSRPWIYTGIFLAVIAGAGILAAVVSLILEGIVGRFVAGIPSAATLIIGIGAGLGLLVWLAIMLGGDHPRVRVLGFALVWAAIAFYMSTAAIRFLFNAIPIFAAFAAGGLVWVIDWLDFGSIRRSLAANRGSFWTGFRKGARPLHYVAAVLIVLLLVFPNVMLAADAALPPRTEQELSEGTDSEFLKGVLAKRFGAYGQGFLPDYWLDGLTWLDDHDANITDWSQRPAFLSWWDYGHWAIAVGNHPSVADNFQNGYQFAARFILAQNETHAVQLLSARLIDLVPDAKAEELLGAAGVTDAAAARDTLERMGCQHQDPTYCRDGFLPELDLEESVALLASVERETGKSIRYFAVDVRMLPYDNPQTAGIEQSSIYYAPVKLAGEDPDEYVPLKIFLGAGLGPRGDGWVTQKEFEEIARNPIRRPQATQERLEFTEKFFDSMFYRAYVGTPADGPFPATGDAVINGLNDPRPAFALAHFRLVYANEHLKILEYYPGATVSGTLTEGGTPLAGAQLTAFDDAGTLIRDSFPEQFRAEFDPTALNVPHSISTTDAEGRYSLIAPFALEGGNVTIVASKDGVELARTHLAITREDAQRGAQFTSDLQLVRGTVSGTLFEDRDGNGVYDAANDTPMADTNLTIGGVSAVSGPDGAFTLTGVPVGQQEVVVDSASHDVAPRSARVRVTPGTTTQHDVALDLKLATVSGVVTVAQEGGDAGAPFLTVQFTADANVTGNTAATQSAFTDSSGNYTATLKPGTYVVTARHSTPDGTAYAYTETIEVATGETRTLDIRLTRQ